MSQLRLNDALYLGLVIIFKMQHTFKITALNNELQYFSFPEDFSVSCSELKIVFKWLL